MSVEDLSNKIKQRIAPLRFTSARFQYALVKEEMWKVFAMRVVFDRTYEVGKIETYIREPNFVLENYWLSLDDFFKFLDYLKNVDVTHVSPANSTQNINDRWIFNLSTYELYLPGNFPGGDLHFHSSQIGKRNGMDRASYYVEYALQGIVQSRTYYEISLTHNEPPFHDIMEAVNHYWKTEYEYSTIGNRISFFMPLLDGSIRSCELEGDSIAIKLDLDPVSSRYRDLSLAVIAKGKFDSYRKKHMFDSDIVKIKLGFRPLSYTVTLNKASMRLDEFSYYAEQQYGFDPLKESSSKSRTHIVWVDAGYRKDEGGHIAWYNETTNQKFRGVSDCGDSFRCEYAAVIHALNNLAEFLGGDEIEIRADNETVVSQLNLEYAFNKEDLRLLAEEIWKIVKNKFNGKVKFFWVPRGKNKAGKILGS